MRVTVYPDEDAMYVQVAGGKVARGRDLDNARHLDFDEDGRLLGIEFLYVSDRIDLNIPGIDIELSHID